MAGLWEAHRVLENHTLRRDYPMILPNGSGAAGSHHTMKKLPASAYCGVTLSPKPRLYAGIDVEEAYL